MERELILDAAKPGMTNADRLNSLYKRDFGLLVLQAVRSRNVEEIQAMILAIQTSTAIALALALDGRYFDNFFQTTRECSDRMLEVTKPMRDAQGVQ